MSPIKSVCLRAIPDGLPNVERDFEVKVNDELLKTGENELKLKLNFISVDPYLRGRMSAGKGLYMSPFQIGEVISNFGVAEVLESRHSDYEAGDLLAGVFPWSTEFVYPITPQTTAVLYKIPKDSTLPPSYYIGVLGMPGQTAYLGLKHLCEPKAGETLFVSAASGAVGQLVGQLGKMWGMRVVGCAGSEEKCEFLRQELKFDAVINYKKYSNYHELNTAIAEACPDGISCNFENVGGEIMDSVLENSNHGARYAMCGLISQYNNKTGEMRPVKNLAAIIGKCLKIEGFIVTSLIKRFGLAEMQKEVSEGLLSGKIIYKEDIKEGDISLAPEVFISMLKGENFGKAVLKLND